jgi:hypothetical protein
MRIIGRIVGYLGAAMIPERTAIGNAITGIPLRKSDKTGRMVRPGNQLAVDLGRFFQAEE